MKVEGEAIYKENSAIYPSKFDVIRGHFMMLPEESVKINSGFVLWLAKNIITRWKRK